VPSRFGSENPDSQSYLNEEVEDKDHDYVDRIAPRLIPDWTDFYKSDENEKN
jgi:hypothetical protein